jgi:hypothetical protein
VTVVMKRRTVAAMAIIGVLVSGTSGFAAEKFQKLGGSQIRAKFVGMEMTDNVHWADVFSPNGSLKSYSMGRKKDGKWWIEKDELCVDRGKDDGGCYQVWAVWEECGTQKGRLTGCIRRSFAAAGAP